MGYCEIIPKASARPAIGSLLSLILLLSSCGPGKTGKSLAEIDGQPVYAADFEKTAGKELSRLREQLYRLEKQKLDEYIGALLLTKEADKRGISVATLLEQEIDSKILPVSDEEINAFYAANKARIPVPLDKVREQIGDHLRRQKTEAQRGLFFKDLRGKSKIVTYLEPPPIFRAQVAINGAPYKGSEKAPVTIVKFEDYQCPFCKQVQGTLSELLTRYNGKVKVVHKDLPLDSIHPEARQAAEAARCANEQGKFWSYHDALYNNSPKAGTEELKRYAKEVGVNLENFDSCLASGKYKAAVQQDLLEGAKLGITGTPAFFINGREISGAQPLEAFAAIIDEELARSRN